MNIRTILLTVIALLPCVVSAKPTPAEFHPEFINTWPTIEVPSFTIDDAFLQVALSQSAITANAIISLDPKLNAEVARRAIDAMHCAMDKGMTVDKVIVVDMNVASSQKRLWAFDLKDQNKPLLVINERVAHGSGSDRNRDGKADKFSNVQNSHMTSLGLYKISERYKGKNGWSRRLDGMLAHFNGKARERAVVMHPSNYVSERRVGNSQGCPAVNQATMDALEKAGLNNTVLWIDGPDESLGKVVAECAKKREAKLLANAATQRERQTIAHQHHVVSAWSASNAFIVPEVMEGWMHVAAVDAAPYPAPREESKVCEKAVRRYPRVWMAACFAPIDTMPFFNRLI